MPVANYYDFFDGNHEYPINVSLALAPKCDTDELESIKYAAITRTSQKSAFENFVVIDTETSGLSPKTAEILEISAIKFEHFQPVSLFTTLCRPEKKITEETIEINGITNSMVEGKPRFQQVADSLLEFIGDSNIVGHNLPFDLEFIVRYGADVTKRKRKYFDTLKIAKKVLKKPKGEWDNDLKAYEVLGDEEYDVDNYRLETLCDYYGIEQHHGHRAADDAFVTGFLFEELLDDYCEGEATSPSYSSGTSVYVSNKNSNASFERLIAGSVLAFGGAGTLFLSWLGALPLLAGLILLAVEYTK